MISQTSVEPFVARWQRYWAGLDGAPGEVFWDADPADGDEDMTHIGDWFDRGLPVLDAGCGNGQQTRFLAQYFDHIMGVDISAAAIEHARAATDSPSISYQVLDLYRPPDAQQLHEQIGDANVYVRGVLHAIPPTKRVRAVSSIERLLGQRGTLYLKEVSPAGEHYLGQIINRHGVPPGLARTSAVNLFPGTLSDQDRATLFPPNRFRLLTHGSGTIHTVHHLPTGEPITVPAMYAVLRRHPH